MCQIDVPHQAEDESRAAGDKEIEAAGDDPLIVALKRAFFPKTASNPGGHGANTSQIDANTARAMMSDHAGWRATNWFMRRPAADADTFGPTPPSRSAPAAAL
jgi:hypothetical protein